MYITSDRLPDPLEARTGRPAMRASRRGLSARQAMALFALGIFVETLGLALIAAFAWWGVGTAVSGIGVWMGWTGHRAWPAPDTTVTVAPPLPGYLRARSRRDCVDTHTNNQER